MKAFYGQVTVAVALVLALVLMVPPVSASETVDDLGWLAGCWASVGGEPGSGEQWMPPAGNSMFGVNRTVANGETGAFEFMQIRRTETGGIEFVAKPSGQKETVFRMTGMAAGEVVFENPDHDFPTKIVYRLAGGSRLEARIEGEAKGVLKAVRFAFDRVECVPEAGAGTDSGAVDRGR